MTRIDPLTDQHYQTAQQGCQECAQLRAYLTETVQPTGLNIDAPLQRLDALETFFKGVVERRKGQP